MCIRKDGVFGHYRPMIRPRQGYDKFWDTACLGSYCDILKFTIAYKESHLNRSEKPWLHTCVCMHFKFAIYIYVQKSVDIYMFSTFSVYIYI